LGWWAKGMLEIARHGFAITAQVRSNRCLGPATPMEIVNQRGPFLATVLHRGGLGCLRHRDGLGRQQIKGPLGVVIDNNRAIGGAFAPGPIVNTDLLRRGRRRQRCRADSVEQQIHPTSETQGIGEPETGSTAQRQADPLMGFGQSVGALRPRRQDCGKAFRKDFAGTRILITEKTADVKDEATTIACPGKIREGARIAAVDAAGRGCTARTWIGGLTADHGERNQGWIGTNRGFLNIQCRLAEARSLHQDGGGLQ
jgi:hypothetical protein